MAQHGFLRDLDFNATVITPWAALFTRRDEALSETVRRYERASFRLTEEVGELRQAALTRQRQLEEAFDGSEMIEYRRRLQRVGEELLTERDRLAAGEAQLGAALGRVATLEDELRRYELAVHDLERLRHSPFWGLLSRYLQLRTTIGRRIRHFLPPPGLSMPAPRFSVVVLHDGDPTNETTTTASIQRAGIARLGDRRERPIRPNRAARS